MLGVSAEFETKLRRERQLEGIAKVKAAVSTRAGHLR
jgi:DNA invertase Pin-like site-specific DNA recombinase